MKPYIIPLLIGLFVMLSRVTLGMVMIIQRELYLRRNIRSWWNWLWRGQYFDYQTGTYRYGYLDMYSAAQAVYMTTKPEKSEKCKWINISCVNPTLVRSRETILDNQLVPSRLELWHTRMHFTNLGCRFISPPVILK